MMLNVSKKKKIKQQVSFWMYVTKQDHNIKVLCGHDVVTKQKLATSVKYRYYTKYNWLSPPTLCTIELRKFFQKMKSTGSITQHLPDKHAVNSADCSQRLAGSGQDAKCCNFKYLIVT